jgi:IS5 family transposase
MPTHPTDLVHFRHRIGKEGVLKILKLSVDLHGKAAKEAEVLIDTTVQEKNITFPTDVKLHYKIIKHCVKIAKSEHISLRQTYKRVSKKLILAQRNKTHPQNRKKAYAAQRKLKTIAGRLVRELERKLSKSGLLKYSKQIDIFKQVLKQKRSGKHKIYSLHETEVYCMSKGKEHKKYEFGSKVSVVVTKKSGIIVGAMSFKNNIHDTHTLPEVIRQSAELVGRRPKVAICDRGYRGMRKCEGTQIEIPKPPKKSANSYEKRKARERFRRRAGIEPIIGHLKSDHRLIRNFLKGSIGDSLNVILAAAAFNLKKWMRQVHFFCFIFRIELFIKDLSESNKLLTQE